LPVEVTVLGRYSPYAAPGGAMNGYLVRHGGTTLLIDCGNGVVPRLLERMPIEQLTAVVISHLHPDHIADAHSLRYAQLTAKQLGRTTAKLQMYAPAEPQQEHKWLEDGEDWQDLQTYDPEQPLMVGELEVRFTRTNHPFPCYAMRIKPAGAEGPVLFYTADTGVHAPLTEAARGADLLLVEASLTEEWQARRVHGHLTAAEAAQMAKDAGVKRCLFTHVWPGLTDLNQLLVEGRPVFPAVELVEEGETYTV
jgi:ribonuclease BN (tRNA processing enzyme)